MCNVVLPVVIINYLTDELVKIVYAIRDAHGNCILVATIYKVNYPNLERSHRTNCSGVVENLILHNIIYVMLHSNFLNFSYVTNISQVRWVFVMRVNYVFLMLNSIKKIKNIDTMYNLCLCVSKYLATPHLFLSIPL